MYWTRERGTTVIVIIIAQDFRSIAMSAVSHNMSTFFTVASNFFRSTIFSVSIIRQSLYISLDYFILYCNICFTRNDFCNEPTYTQANKQYDCNFKLCLHNRLICLIINSFNGFSLHHGTKQRPQFIVCGRISYICRHSPMVQKKAVIFRSIRYCIEKRKVIIAVYIHRKRKVPDQKHVCEIWDIPFNRRE